MARNGRLLRLARHLENLPAPKRRRFNLDSWFRVSQGVLSRFWKDVRVHKKDTGYRRAVIAVPEGACGTSACAVGHALGIPEFQRAGLLATIPVRDDGRPWTGAIEPFYKGERAWGAVREFFELDTYSSHYLFSEHNYRVRERTDPKAVAARIREFVKSDGPVPRSELNEYLLGDPDRMPEDE